MDSSALKLGFTYYIFGKLSSSDFRICFCDILLLSYALKEPADTQHPHSPLLCQYLNTHSNTDVLDSFLTHPWKHQSACYTHGPLVILNKQYPSILLPLFIITFHKDKFSSRGSQPSCWAAKDNNNVFVLSAAVGIEKRNVFQS